MSFIDYGNAMFSPGTSDLAFFMVHSLDVAVRREHEHAVLQHYHAALVAHGVDATKYPFERCWHDYRFNMWRALLSLCAMAPGLLKAKRSQTGAFTPDATITDDDRKTARTYEALNARAVAALVDHKWLELLLDESEQNCGLCSGLSLCY